MAGMMTCREVSTLVSTGGLETASLGRRMAVWLHLSMCRHCRAFRRQIDTMARAAHLVSSDREREPADGFEERVAKRLRP